MECDQRSTIVFLEYTMNKKLLSSFIKVFKNACVIFTFVVFAFYIMGVIASNALQTLTISRMALVFAFSFWFALCNLFLSFKSLNVVLRIALHFISSTFGFYVIFLLIPGYTKNQSSSFALVIAFVIAYAIIGSVCGLIRSALNKKDKQEEEYNSIYNKKQKGDQE